MRPEEGKDGAEPAPAGSSYLSAPHQRPSAPAKGRHDIAEPTDSQVDPQHDLQSVAWHRDVLALSRPLRTLSICRASGASRPPHLR